MTKTLFSSAAIALALIASPAAAQTAPHTASATAEASKYDADRAAILAMAGDYKVQFDMQESTAWLAGYEPLDRKTSGGHESVRVIEDTGERIVLQHLLVAGPPGKEFVIKHWRQDWEYEPARILVYEGNGRWEWQDVPADERAGSWSQTVYQVDDSPRYAGVGAWETQNGITRWISGESWRPLARRDATRDPIYDRYASINRHKLTPTGWIHWQDNIKMMPADEAKGDDTGTQSGALTPVVQEYVLNTYDRFSDYNTGAADAYWAATSSYWAAVRAKWDEVAATKGGIVIEEEADTGTVISGQLLGIANLLMDGKMSEDEAVAEALELIDTHTEEV